ncbi:hypothetical protein [Streptomyces sp. NRRL S-31]|uniref:hypothetical protein n=1 Tax=Streptomyces sp. NRRL S-31 TaxID=1463898 RepID=UPI000B057734|nr:hypothetical protein [Streptomyces sp. NRRL S-31]
MTGPPPVKSVLRIGGTTARVEALERALAEAVQQMADLRGRVEALESGGGGRGH